MHRDVQVQHRHKQSSEINVNKWIANIRRPQHRLPRRVFSAAQIEDREKFLLFSFMTLHALLQKKKKKINENYLYLCHSDNTIDHRVMRRPNSMEHIDYSIDPNAMEMHMKHMNIDQDHDMIDTTRDTFYMFVLGDRKIVNQDIPYIDHHRAYNVDDTMCTLTDRHL